MSDPAASTPDPLAGTVIAGRYELLDRIGSGSMGAVYRARHRSHGGMVAVKVLRAGLADSPESRKRFGIEARNGAALTHPNTVRVIDSGADGDLLFLVMEYLQGRPLSAVLAGQGALPWPRCVRIATQILKSLREAHARGIVHRDVKPSNLMLLDLPDEPDFVKVVDLGISRSLDASGAGTQGAIGTAAYIPPEQWRDADVDDRADLYSTGCVLFEMLAGRTPFQAASFAGYFRLHAETPPPDPRGLMPGDTPRDLVDLVLSLLRKDPRDRPESAQAVLEALAGIRPHPTLGDRRAPPVFHALLRRPRRWVVPALMALAAASVGAWILLRRSAPEIAETVPAPLPAGVCVMAPTPDPKAPQPGATLRANQVAASMREAGLPTDCTGLYPRDEDRYLYATRFGMIQGDGRASASDLEAVRVALLPRYPDVAVRPGMPGLLLRPIEFLVPDEAPAVPPPVDPGVLPPPVRAGALERPVDAGALEGRDDPGAGNAGAEGVPDRLRGAVHPECPAFRGRGGPRAGAARRHGSRRAGGAGRCAATPVPGEPDAEGRAEETVPALRRAGAGRPALNAQGKGGNAWA